MISAATLFLIRISFPPTPQPPPHLRPLDRCGFGCCRCGSCCCAEIRSTTTTYVIPSVDKGERTRPRRPGRLDGGRRRRRRIAEWKKKPTPKRCRRNRGSLRDARAASTGRRPADAAPPSAGAAVASDRVSSPRSRHAIRGSRVQLIEAPRRHRRPRPL